MGRRFRAEQTGREEEELEEEELEEEELEEEERRGGGMYIHVCVPANREASKLRGKTVRCRWAAMQMRAVLGKMYLLRYVAFEPT